MIKEAGFQWPISHGESASLFLCFSASLFLAFFASLFLCFLPSLLLCLLFLLISLAEFLYLVSRISVGFQQAFRLSTKAWISVRKTPLITF